MDIEDDVRFEQRRQEAETFYKSIEGVWCPYFKEKVVFNAKGLEHIKFKGVRQARTRVDQYVRFRLIAFAPKIIQASHTLQGITKRRNFEREKTNSRWESTMRLITYYEFVAVINETRIRIIIKQVEDGPKYFWSIIPFWRMNKITGEKIIHSGKPEVD